MIKFGKDHTVFIDCDETLLCWQIEKIQHSEDDLITFEDKDHIWRLLPHKKHIEFLKNLKSQGYKIIVWSAASGEWAQRVVDKLNIERFVDLTCSKPSFVIDDLLKPNQIIKSILWIDPITGEFKRNE